MVLYIHAYRILNIYYMLYINITTLVYMLIVLSYIHME